MATDAQPTLQQSTAVPHGDPYAVDAHHGTEAFYADPTFWVLMAFILFFVVLFYLKIHKTLAGLLDERSEKIARQIDEARTLREEAQALLAQYQRQQMEASKEAEDIIKHAEEDAKIITDQAEKDREALVARRTQLAEEKIAQSEALAIQEVQQAAVTVAMASARTLIAENVKGGLQEKLVEQSVSDLDKNVH